MVVVGRARLREREKRERVLQKVWFDSKSNIEALNAIKITLMEARLLKNIPT